MKRPFSSPTVTRTAAQEKQERVNLQIDEFAEFNYSKLANFFLDLIGMMPRPMDSPDVTA